MPYVIELLDSNTDFFQGKSKKNGQILRYIFVVIIYCHDLI